MPNSQQHYLKKLLAAIGRLRSLDISAFQAEIPFLFTKIEDLKDFLSDANEDNLCIHDYGTLKELSANLNSILNYIPRVQKYFKDPIASPTGKDDYSRFNSIYNETIEKLEWMGTLEVEPTQSVSVDEYQARIEKLQLELEAKNREYNARLDSLQKRMEDATLKAENLPNQIAESHAFKPIIDEHAKELKAGDYREYKEASIRSFKGLLFSILLLIFFLIGGYEAIFSCVAHVSKNITEAMGLYPYINLYDKNWQYYNFVLFSFLISKTATIISLTYGIYFFSRNFYAFRHNSILIQNRISAMKTYEKFVSHPDILPATKEEITAFAGEAIFSHKDTGFLKSANRKGMDLSFQNLMDLIGSIGSRSGENK